MTAPRTRRRLRSGGSGGIFVLGAAQFMLVVDAVVLNVALPSLRSDLGMNDSQLMLTTVSYTAAFGSLLIAASRAGDAFGRRRVLYAGLLLFTTASMLAGVAHGPPELLAARTLQGVGAALISPNAFALLLEQARDTAARNRALGAWGAIGAAGGAAGQVLGGVVVETVGWRWVFVLNMPVGLLAAVLVTRLREERGPTPTRLSARSAGLLAMGLVSAIVVLTQVTEHVAGSQALPPLLIAVAALWAFVRRERSAAVPLLDRRLWRTPGVVVGNLVMALNAATTTACLFFVTLYMQVVLGHSALVVGLAFLPFTVLISAAAPSVARAVTRHGVRAPLQAGGVLTVGGVLGLSVMSPHGSYWIDVLPPLLLIAAGASLTYVPSFITATAEVPADARGAASGLLNTCQEIGPAVGLSAVVAVSAVVSGSSPGSAGLVEGYRAGLVAAAVLASASAVLASRVPRGLGARPDRSEQSRSPSTAQVAAGRKRSPVCCRLRSAPRRRGLSCCVSA